MIGLVNAAGSAQQSRVESASKSVRDRLEEQAQQLAPILNSEQAASKVLRSAVDAMTESLGPPTDRSLPTGQQSDRFAQFELEAGSTTPALGTELDVTV